MIVANYGDLPTLRKLRGEEPELAGDWLSRQFAAVGITPERYAAAKQALGMPPTCECEERREWLNRAHAWWRGGD